MGTVGVVRVVGVWVDSAVVWTVWVVVGAEGTLSICVVPELSGRMDGENTGRDNWSGRGPSLGQASDLGK